MNAIVIFIIVVVIIGKKWNQFLIRLDEVLDDRVSASGDRVLFLCASDKKQLLVLEPPSTGISTHSLLGLPPLTSSGSLPCIVFQEDWPHRHCTSCHIWKYLSHMPSISPNHLFSTRCRRSWYLLSSSQSPSWTLACPAIEALDCWPG